MVSFEKQIKWTKNEVETINMICTVHYPNRKLIIGELGAFSCTIKWNDGHVFVKGDLEKVMNRLCGLTYDLNYLLDR